MEQILELENKIKEISDIYENQEGILKYQFFYFNKLFKNFAKNGIYFLIRKNNNKGDKKDYIFVGDKTYFETSFWKFDKKIIPYNQNFTYPIHFSFHNDGSFGLFSTVQTTKDEIKNFEINILQKITKEIPSFKLISRNYDTLTKKNEGRVSYGTDKMTDFSNIEKYFKIIDKILSEFDGVEKIQKNNFLTVLNNRINFIYEKKLEKLENNNSEKNNISTPKTNTGVFNKTSQLLNCKKQIILYGPPGTGKTYSIKNIIENHSRENYIDLQNDGRVKFITFHQSFSYEEFIEGIKPNLDGDSEEISYKIEDGIFKKISIDSLFDNLIFENFQEDLNYTELYDILIDKFKEDDILLLKSKDDKNINIRNISDRNSLHCYHENSSVKHTVGKDRLKKIYDKYNSLELLQKVSNMQEEFTNIIGGANQTVYWAVLNQLLIYKEELKKENIDTTITYEKKKELIKNNSKEKFKNNKNYYLVIDEINRGNISEIFGELITLLECDKRLGEKNKIITTLPYSKEEFGIPKNLYIVATMNTSDKSIVSLDTALRRRFGFKEMLPNYKLLELESLLQIREDESDDIKNSIKKLYEKINLSKLLQKINNRIEYLIDKDHLIGHSYFLKINNLSYLKLVIYNEIVPLLEEYFYSEDEKIKLVLGKDFFEKNELFNESLFENKGDFEIDENNEKLKYLEDEEFITALEKIIN